MKKFTIYHNSRCSKSRKTLEILHSHHINPIIIDYLKSPLNMKQLIELRSYFDMKDFVRTNEPVFNNLNLTLEDENKVLEAMQENPILMQRPIVLYDGRAIIGRPPEKVLALIE